ncbi:MAG: transient receptor potential cation channel subfamily er 1 [Herminiimonas sp.]|nr:transient receptor potential cation channel subfamily er 1 [Herminiimonas sp.]
MARREPPGSDSLTTDDARNHVEAEREKNAIALKTRKAVDTKYGLQEESASEMKLALPLESSSVAVRELSHSPKKSGKATNPAMGTVRVVRRSNAGLLVHRDDSSKESADSAQESESNEEKSEKGPESATQDTRDKSKALHRHPGASSTRRSAHGLIRQPRLNPEVLKSVKPHSLHMAAALGNPEVVRTWLEAHPEDIEKTDDRNRTPLHVAVRKRNRATTHALLQAGANADASDFNGIAPLAIAADNNDTAIAAVLLEARASIDQADKRRRTPLIHAAKKGHGAMVKYLIASSADVNRPANGSTTALTEAADCSDLNVAAMRRFYVDLNDANAQALLKSAKAEAKGLVALGELESTPFHDFLRQLPVRLHDVASLAPPQMTTWLCTGKGLHPLPAALIVQAWSRLPTALKSARMNKEAAAALATSLATALKTAMQTDAFMAALSEASTSLLLGTFIHAQISALHTFSMTTLLAPHVDDATLAEIVGAVRHRALSFREAARACGIDEARFDHWMRFGT